MFDVYCARHRSTVVLFDQNIAAVVNGPDDLELHWRCTCGQTGVKHFARRRPRRVEEGVR